MIDYRPAVTRRYVPNIKPTNEEIQELEDQLYIVREQASIHREILNLKKNAEARRTFNINNIINK